MLNNGNNFVMIVQSFIQRNLQKNPFSTDLSLIAIYEQDVNF